MQGVISNLTMKPILYLLRKNKRLILGSFALSTLTVLLLQFPLILNSIVGLETEVRQIERTVFAIRIKNPNPGSYFVLASRPLGVCALISKGRVLVSNGDLFAGLLDDQMLAGTFTLTAESASNPLELRCSGMDALPWAGREITPIITDRKVGRVLAFIHYVRINLLGAGFSLILLIIVLMDRYTSSSGQKLHSAHILFAIVAFLYSVSLSKFQHTFYGPTIGAATQFLLRGFLTTSFIQVCTTYIVPRPKLVVAMFSASIAYSIFSLLMPTLASKYYYFYILPASIGTALILAIDSLKKPVRSRSAYIQTLALVWLFMQIEVTLLIWADVTLFFSGGFIAIATFILIHAILNDRVDLEILATAQRMELSSLVQINSVAEMVAHDIRSPVAALNGALRRLSNIPAEDRALLEVVAKRIQSIAEHLLAFRKSAARTPLPIRAERTEIGPLLDELINEKRTQFSNEPNLTVHYTYHGSDNPVGLAAASELKRVLSNLIDNAAQAMNYSGTISITAKSASERTLLFISDTGPGFPKELIPRLGQRGVTSRQDGNGLGLFHARTTIESWGGSLKLESGSPKGAIVIIELLPR